MAKTGCFYPHCTFSFCKAVYRFQLVFDSLTKTFPVHKAVDKRKTKALLKRKKGDFTGILENGFSTKALFNRLWICAYPAAMLTEKRILKKIKKSFSAALQKVPPKPLKYF